MMSQNALFAFEHHPVRTFFVLGVVWFVAADVAKPLGFRDARDATRGLDDDEKGTHIVRTLGGDQEHIVVNEFGLYRLLFTSRKPEAERFKRWLAHEVLPMIRRYGYYAPHRKPMSQSKMLIEGRVLFTEEYERRRPDGAAAVSERAVCAALGERIVAEHPEWLVPLATKAAHDWFYHSWARDEAKATKEHDPDQPELWSHYSVLRDGRERWVPRETLSREETKAFLTRGARMRDAWRQLINKLWRHDQALVADFNARSESPLAAAEVQSIAPDLEHER